MDTPQPQSLSRRAAILQDIDHCCARAGRPAGSVRLIAVSKGQPVTAMAALATEGQRAFGENYVQEALAKMPVVVETDIEWHFLGPLQRNKARFVAAGFHWLHSLDSLALARALARHLASANRTLEVLIGVDMLEDGRKHGIRLNDLPAFIERFLADTELGLRLHLRGLMTIGPHETQAAAAIRVFGALRRARETCAQRFGLAGFDQLSMGMSDDYPLAIGEGATIVRIGRALFGERPPRN